MIDLNFGKYGIRTADKLNIVLYENVINQKPESENFGSVSRKTLGYYHSLQQALQAYSRFALADETANNVTELLEAISRLENTIKEVTNE